jgi:integral membrane protein
MNNSNVKTPLKRFLNIGTIEGISYLLLLFIAMPLKYYAGMPEAVKVVGLIHGVLFIAYIILLIYVTNFYGWRFKTVILAFIVSLIPFGTFYLKNITRNAV